MSRRYAINAESRNLRYLWAKPYAESLLHWMSGTFRVFIALTFRVRNSRYLWAKRTFRVFRVPMDRGKGVMAMM